MAMKRFYSDHSGVAAVEFAFIAPILLVILIGTVDFGRYINDKMKIEAAARAAVEYLITTRDPDSVFENVIEPIYDAQGDANWQATFTIETDLSCECFDGLAVECEFGFCEDALDDGSPDYKRRFYSTTLNKTHDTLFFYPGFKKTYELRGDARMQLD